jgi:hypothetical protein
VLLATTVVADTDGADSYVLYPQLSRFSSSQRRLIYWRCACVFFATAFRVLPNAQRVLYTNDDRSAWLDGHDLHAFLSERLGVTIVPLEFKRFKTTGSLCQIFRNNYYKFEVLEHLAHQTEKFVILADSDCIWLRPANTFNNIDKNALHLVRVLGSEVVTEAFQGISRKSMGEIFRKLDPSYPERFPVWFGSELLAGPVHVLRQLSHDLEQNYERFRLHPQADQLRIGYNGILENDEWLLSFVLGSKHYPLSDARQWFTRVWTGPDGHPSVDSLKLCGLHLLAEKHLGFRTIFPQIVDHRSKFWAIELDLMPSYLGGYFGVPLRTHWPNYSMVEQSVRWMGRGIRRLGVRVPAHRRISQFLRAVIPRI